LLNQPTISVTRVYTQVSYGGCVTSVGAVRARSGCQWRRRRPFSVVIEWRHDSREHDKHRSDGRPATAQRRLQVPRQSVHVQGRRTVEQRSAFPHPRTRLATVLFVLSFLLHNNNIIIIITRFPGP